MKLVMKKYKKVVLKIGSALISETNVSSSHLVNNLTNQISNADKDIQSIIVSSGAISQGMKILNINNKQIDLESLQALAAIGQQKLMGLYEKSFTAVNRLIAQVLLTHDDRNDRSKYKNATATIDNLRDLNIIPIRNEHTVVETEEKRLGA